MPEGFNQLRGVYTRREEYAKLMLSEMLRSRGKLKAQHAELRRLITDLPLDEAIRKCKLA